MIEEGAEKDVMSKIKITEDIYFLEGIKDSAEQLKRAGDELNESLIKKIKRQFEELTPDEWEDFGKETMAEVDELASSALKVEDAAIPDLEGSAASAVVMQDSLSTAPKDIGAVDLRAMNIITQPMGSFSGLDYSPAALSSSALEAFDFEQELESLKMMVKSKRIPSPIRDKEAELILDKDDVFFLARVNIYNIRARYQDYKRSLSKRADKEFTNEELSKIKKFFHKIDDKTKHKKK